MGKTKSRVLCGVLAVLVFVLAASDKPKLVKTKVNENLSLLIPKGWIPMDAMDFTERYPSVRAPVAADTNQERTVDFSVNVSATQWPDGNLEMPKQFFKASLMNMFDRVEIIDEGIREVGGRRMIYFEFQSRVNGNRQGEGLRDPVLRYTSIQYLVEPKRTLVFSFNCPQRYRQEWEATARAMMKGVKIK